MMQGLEKRPYNGMPKEHHLFSLLKGGLRETVIMVYAVSRQIEIQWLKVEVGRVQTENEVRILTHWNSFLKDAVDPPSLGVFKSRLGISC